MADFRSALDRVEALTHALHSSHIFLARPYTEIQHDLAALQGAILALGQRSRRLLNDLAPINRLPPEIMTKIFWLVQPEIVDPWASIPFGTATEEDHERASPFHVYLWVCSKWRLVSIYRLLP